MIEEVGRVDVLESTARKGFRIVEQMGYGFRNADFAMARQLIVGFDEHGLPFISAIWFRRGQGPGDRGGDGEFGVCILFCFRDIFHCIIDDCESVDLSEQVLTIVVRSHGKREPRVVIVQPLVVSLLKYDPRRFVKTCMWNKLSWKAESTLRPRAILETCGIMMFAVHLTGQDDVKHVHHHRFFERRMIWREIRLKCTTAGLGIAFVDDFFGHALNANMFDVIQQPVAKSGIILRLFSKGLWGPAPFDPELK